MVFLEHLSAAAQDHFAAAFLAANHHVVWPNLVLEKNHFAAGFGGKKAAAKWSWAVA
jgi:hypothetical protein